MRISLISLAILTGWLCTSQVCAHEYPEMQSLSHAELLERFGDEDFEAWPLDLRASAYRRRGAAAAAAGDYVQAGADFEWAVEHGLHYHYRGTVLLRLGDIYRDALDDPHKALAAYRAVGQARSKIQHHTRAVTAAAGLMLQMDDAAAALRELDAIDVRAASRSRHAVDYLAMRGRALAAAGRRRDAVAAFREGLQLAAIEPDMRAELEQAIEDVMLSDGTDLVVAAGGRTEHQVVVPATTMDPRVAGWLDESAALIRRALAANGFDIPVVKEGAHDPERPGIYLGDTQFARAQGIDPSGLQGWSYIHRAIGADIVITGNDRPHPLETEGASRPRATGARVGTVKGVADFLRQYARVRFLYPCGETGIEYQETPVITVPAGLDTLFVPRLDFFFSNWMGPRGALDADWYLYFIANNYYPSISGVGNPHSYQFAVPASVYGESHPEYFALINNRRNPSTHLCVSNPEVQRLLYQHVLDELDKGYDMTTLGQQDGFRGCQCANCHALYDTGDDWGEKLWRLHYDMAQRLLVVRPDKKVILIVYGETWTPPRSFDEFPPNVMLRMRSPTPERRAAWQDYKVPGGYFAGLSHFGTYGSFGYLPRQTPAAMAELTPVLDAFGFRGIFLDIAFHNFGLQGPTYYVLGRLWENPQNPDTVELLEEFYAAAFQAAAIPMERFFDALHNALDLYRDMPPEYVDIYGATRRRFARGDTMSLMSTVFQPDTLNDMETFLAQAEQAPVSEKVRARLALVRLEFDYLRHLAGMAHIYHAYRIARTTTARGMLLDAVDAANAFIDHMLTPEIRRRPVPGWPEVRFLMGHHRGLITRGFANTPLNWDTADINH